MFGWNAYPYTDFNKVNLDWICRQISACGTFWTASNFEMVLDPDLGTGAGFYPNDLTGPGGATPENSDAVFYDDDGITYVAFIDDFVGGEYISFRRFRLTGPQGEPGESGGGGTGITEDIKQALLQLAQKVAYIDANGADYYQDLYDALYEVQPPATLVSIDAVYTQSGTVYDTDTLDSLKPDLVVTATYSDSTTAVIPAADYTLSGSLTVGSSVVTVSYSGQTDTFTVTVTENPAPPVTLVSIDAVYTQSGTVYDTDTLDSLKTDLVVTATYSDSSTAVIPAADYTLSGSLTVGSSVITVTYSGQTDTFTVTVSAAAPPVYEMENGTAAFSGGSYAGRSITVSNHNHISYTNENPSSSASTPGTYALIDPVSSNTVTPNTNNINLNTTLFTIPANTPVVVELSNISCTAVTADKWAVALRSNNTSVITTGDMNFSISSKTVNATLNSSTNITALFIYTTAGSSSIEFDITVTVGGVRWL